MMRPAGHKRFFLTQNKAIGPNRRPCWRLFIITFAAGSQRAFAASLIMPGTSILTVVDTRRPCE
jgi:hypothetical protein